MNTWVNRRGLDLVIAAAGVGVYSALAARSDPLGSLAVEGRSAFFEVSAMLTGAFFAVAITAMAIVGGLAPGARIRFVLANAGPALNRQLVACAAAFGSAAAAYVVLLVIVSPTDVSGSWRFAAVGFALLTLLRMGRLLYLLKALLDAAAVDASDDAPDAATAPPWSKPDVDPAEYGLPRVPRSSDVDDASA